MPTTTRTKKPTAKDFQSVYDELKKIMAPFARKTLKAHEAPGQMQLIAPPVSRSRGKEVWFGAVKINKNYISYHLMPVYACPDLLESISPELKKRMQGKACFNFTTIDKALFQELKTLTKKGHQRFKTEGLI